MVKIITNQYKKPQKPPWGLKIKSKPT